MILVFERFNLPEIIFPMEEEKKTSHYKTVIVGLSGGLNSAVAAMLLKIQKIDLIAVTIDSGSVYGSDPAQNFSCHIESTRLQKIKDFCHSINIPLHVIKSSEVFNEEVVERWIAQKLCGAIKDQCFSCHKMRMRLLYDKMIEHKADGIVTGHFAKVYTNPTTGEVSISSANDELHDQSHLLGTLPQSILSKLILPLSDLSTKEVDKLAANFFLNFESPKIKINDCFPQTEETKNFLESRVPVSLRSPGEIYDLGRVHNLGTHSGVHNLEFEKDIQLQGRHGNSADHLRLARYSLREKIVEVAEESSFKGNAIQLIHCAFMEDVDTSFPFRAWVKVEDSFYEGMVYPKNLLTVFIQLEEDVTLFEGVNLTCYKKKGKNSKVYLNGKVKRLKKIHLTAKVDNPDNEENIEPSVDHEKYF